MLRLSVLALTVSMSVAAFAAPQKMSRFNRLSLQWSPTKRKLSWVNSCFLIRVYLSQALFLVTHATT